MLSIMARVVGLLPSYGCSRILECSSVVLRFPSRSRKALYAAARTCKLFCRPALKLLWRDLPSINALLCALSTSVGVVENPFASEGLLGVTGPITDSERKRFAQYASFIRTIDIRATSAIHSDVYRHVAQLDEPLIPHLRTICCHQEWSRAVEVILRLSGPSLRSLVLGSCYVSAEYEPHFLEQLDALCAAAPNVQMIKIHGSGGMTAQTLIGGMKHLRSLDLAGSYTCILHGMDNLETLANMEDLEELALRDDCDQPVFERCPALPCTGFASLRKLTVQSGIRSIPELLAGLPDLRLKELHLDDLGYEYVSTFEDLIQSCSTELRNSIENLNISYGYKRVSKIVPTDPLISIISPFFSLPHIKEFSLTSYEYPWLVDDSSLRTIAHAWPDLVSLRLSCHSPIKVGGEEPVAPSIHGIADLANRCAGLRSVRLSPLVMLRAVRIVEAAYYTTTTRWPPLGAKLPEDRAVENVETERLVDIMWPLFGVTYSSKENAFSEKWNAVLREVARVQTQRRWGKGTQYLVAPGMY
ncbi:hypothetical protein C8Q72DRAFT_559652 [Fomitopsis betulina]|nr:hypothetical protein C8Q72DRAFT_559652 [Fomitopsis betulina]